MPIVCEQSVIDIGPGSP